MFSPQTEKLEVMQFHYKNFHSLQYNKGKTIQKNFRDIANIALLIHLFYFKSSSSMKILNFGRCRNLEVLTALPNFSTTVG